MDAKYEEAFGTTKSVITIYEKLASLEKQNKQDTKEYEDYISLLGHMTSIEKRKYQSLASIDLFQNFQTDSKQFQDKYFIVPNRENLEKIRFSNWVDDKHMYALDGVLLRENIQFLQKNLDIAFFLQLNYYLKRKTVSEEERNTMIDFKYGLLASSKYLEENFLSGELFLPFTNVSMSESELELSSTYIFGKVEELIIYLWDLTDAKMNEQTLPIILYVKACFGMLPQDLLDGILSMLESTFVLNKLQGYFEGESREKITSMTTYLVEFSNYAKSKK